MKRMIPLLMLAAISLGACDQNMDAQPDYREYSRVPLFGAALRAPAAGSVARDETERDRAITSKRR